MTFSNRIIFFVLLISLITFGFGATSISSCPGIINDGDLTSFGPPPEDSGILTSNITITGNCFDFNISEGAGLNLVYMLNCDGYTIDTNSGSNTLFNLDNNAIDKLILINCNIVLDDEASLITLSNNSDINDIYLLDTNVLINSGQAFYFDNYFDSELNIGFGAIGFYGGADINIQGTGVLLLQESGQVLDLEVTGLDIVDFNSYYVKNTTCEYDVGYDGHDLPYSEGMIFDFEDVGDMNFNVCLDNPLYLKYIMDYSHGDLYSQALIKYSANTDVNIEELNFSFCGSQIDVNTGALILFEVPEFNENFYIDEINIYDLNSFMANNYSIPECSANLYVRNSKLYAYPELSINNISFNDSNIDFGIMNSENSLVYFSGQVLYSGYNDVNIYLNNTLISDGSTGINAGNYDVISYANMDTVNIYDNKNIDLNSGIYYSKSNYYSDINANLYSTTIESFMNSKIFSGRFNHISLDLTNDLNLYNSKLFNLRYNDVILTVNNDVYLNDSDFFYTAAGVDNLDLYANNIYAYDDSAIFNFYYYSDGNINLVDVNYIGLNNSSLIYSSARLDLNFDGGLVPIVSDSNIIIDKPYVDGKTAVINLTDLNVNTDKFVFFTSNISNCSLDLNVNNSTIYFNTLGYFKSLSLTNAISSEIYNNIFVDKDDENIIELDNDNDIINFTTFNFNTDQNLNRENIVGRLGYGGNYWTNLTNTGYSDECADLDKDNICDDSYLIYSYGAEDFVDAYPLAPESYEFDLNVYLFTADPEDLNLGNSIDFNLCFSNTGDVNVSDYNAVIEGYVNSSWLEVENVYYDQNLIVGDSNCITGFIGSMNVGGTTLFRGILKYSGNDQNTLNDYDSVNVDVNGADLNAVSISFDLNELDYGENVLITFAYENAGDYSVTSDYNVCLYANDVGIYCETRSDDLSVGDSNTLEYSWTTNQSGEVEISGIIFNSVVEKYSDNNSVSDIITVGGAVLRISECPEFFSSSDLGKTYILDNDLNGECFTLTQIVDDDNSITINCNGHQIYSASSSEYFVSLYNSVLNSVNFVNCDYNASTGLLLVRATNLARSGKLSSINIIDSNINAIAAYNPVIRLYADDDNYYNVELNITNSNVNYPVYGGDLIDIQQYDINQFTFNAVNSFFNSPECSANSTTYLIRSWVSDINYIELNDININVDCNEFATKNLFSFSGDSNILSLEFNNSNLDLNGSGVIYNEGRLENIEFNNTNIRSLGLSGYLLNSSPTSEIINLTFDINNQINFNFQNGIFMYLNFRGDAPDNLTELNIFDLNIVNYGNSDEEARNFMDIDIDDNALFLPNVNIINSDIDVNMDSGLIIKYNLESGADINQESLDFNFYGSRFNIGTAKFLGIELSDENNYQFSVDNLNIWYANVVNSYSKFITDEGINDVNTLNIYDSNISQTGGLSFDDMSLFIGQNTNNHWHNINIIDTNLYINGTSPIFFGMGQQVDSITFNFEGSNIIDNGFDPFGFGLFMLGPMRSMSLPAPIAFDSNNFTISNYNGTVSRTFVNVFDSTTERGYLRANVSLGELVFLDSNIEMANGNYLISLDDVSDTNIDISFDNSVVFTDGNLIAITDLGLSNPPVIYNEVILRDLNIISSTPNSYLIVLGQTQISDLNINNSLLQIDGLILDLNSSIVNGIIYDNYFKDVNVDNNLFSMNGSTFNIDFNSTIRDGRNIYGSNYKGGNYWTNLTNTGNGENCVDAVAPIGICDVEFSLGIDSDYLPLSNNGPDLIAYNVYSDSDNYSYGDLVDANFYYKNMGDGNLISIDFNIVFELMQYDNVISEINRINYYDTNVDFNVLYYEQLSFDANMLGDYNVVARFEYDFYDKNTLNDENYKTISIYAPDLSAISIDLSPSDSVQKNTIVDINFGYKNIGNVAITQDYNVSIYADDLLLCSETRNDLLDVNDTNYFSCDYNFTSSNYYDIMGVVSYNGIDANSDNNSIIVELTVYGQIIHDYCPGSDVNALLNEVIILATDINFTDSNICFDINSINDQNKFFYLDCDGKGLNFSSVDGNFRFISLQNSSLDGIELNNCNLSVDAEFDVNSAYNYENNNLLNIVDSNLNYFSIENTILDFNMPIILFSFDNVDLNRLNFINSNIDLNRTSLLAIRNSNVSGLTLDFTDSNVSQVVYSDDYNRQIEDFNLLGIGFMNDSDLMFFGYINDSNIQSFEVLNLDLDLAQYGTYGEGSADYDIPYSFFIINDCNVEELNLFDSDINFYRKESLVWNTLLFINNSHQEVLDVNYNNTVVRPLGPLASLMVFNSSADEFNMSDVNFVFTDTDINFEEIEDMNEEELQIYDSTILHFWNLLIVPYAYINCDINVINIDGYHNNFFGYDLMMIGSMQYSEYLDVLQSHTSEINISNVDVNTLINAIFMGNMTGDLLDVEFSNTNIGTLINSFMIGDSDYNRIDIHGLEAGFDYNYWMETYPSLIEGMTNDMSLLYMDGSNVGAVNIYDTNVVYDKLFQMDDTNIINITLHNNYLVDYNVDNNLYELDDDFDPNDVNILDIDFNSEFSVSKNIIGNPYSGGNYWTQIDGNGYSENCVDVVAPIGICDESRDLGTLFSESEIELLSIDGLDELPLSDEGPDLVASLSLSASTIATNTNINITTGYRNDGTLDANEDLEINVYANNVLICNTIISEDILIDDSDSYVCSESFSSTGTYTIRTELVYDGYDKDLSNNTVSRTLTVSGSTRTHTGGGNDDDEEESEEDYELNIDNVRLVDNIIGLNNTAVIDVNISKDGDENISNATLRLIANRGNESIVIATQSFSQKLLINDKYTKQFVFDFSKLSGNLLDYFNSDNKLQLTVEAIGKYNTDSKDVTINAEYFDASLKNVYVFVNGNRYSLNNNSSIVLEENDLISFEIVSNVVKLGSSNKTLTSRLKNLSMNKNIFTEQKELFGENGLENSSRNYLNKDYVLSFSNKFDLDNLVSNNLNDSDIDVSAGIELIGKNESGKLVYSVPVLALKEILFDAKSELIQFSLSGDDVSSNNVLQFNISYTIEDENVNDDKNIPSSNDQPGIEGAEGMGVIGSIAEMFADHYYVKYYSTIGTGEEQLIYVYDEDKIPVKNAEIAIHNGLYYSGITDDTGLLSFKMDVQGIYDLNVKIESNLLRGKFKVIDGYITTEADFVELSNIPEGYSEMQSKARIWLIIIAIAILVILSGILYYFLFVRKQKPKLAGLSNLS